MTARRTPRIGKWLPEDDLILRRWLDRLIKRVTARPGYDSPQQWAPVIQDFRTLIETDPTLYMLFHQMFHQIPNKPPFDKDPDGRPQVENYIVMLECFNEIIQTAPAYEADTGLVGFPLNAIIDWPMGTPAGQAAFLNDKVNAQIKKMLDEWGSYLKTPPSASVLNKNPETGWFGIEAMQQMPDFADTYQCDPSDEHYGFTSWDDFFTRKFQDNVRPVYQQDDDRFISNACESAPYNIQKHVKALDLFWLKGQPYSLNHMLAEDSYTEQFVGGTIYQAFLSALSYHRWHSPVKGTVVKTVIIPGSYYSEARMVGFDESAPNESQGYITEVATRGLIYIQADNPDIGLMIFMAVGMAEVSTCDITVTEGQSVIKGQEIGMFHFGGSTHCLIFRKGVNVIFQLDQKPGLDATNINVNSIIGFVPSTASPVEEVYRTGFSSNPTST